MQWVVEESWHKGYMLARFCRAAHDTFFTEKALSLHRPACSPCVFNRILWLLGAPFLVVLALSLRFAQFAAIIQTTGAFKAIYSVHGVWWACINSVWGGGNVRSVKLLSGRLARLGPPGSCWAYSPWPTCKTLFYCEKVGSQRCVWPEDGANIWRHTGKYDIIS